MHRGRWFGRWFGFWFGHKHETVETTTTTTTTPRPPAPLVEIYCIKASLFPDYRQEIDFREVFWQPAWLEPNYQQEMEFGSAYLIDASEMLQEEQETEVTSTTRMLAPLQEDFAVGVRLAEDFELLVSLDVDYTIQSEALMPVE